MPSASGITVSVLTLNPFGIGLWNRIGTWHTWAVVDTNPLKAHL